MQTAQAKQNRERGAWAMALFDLDGTLVNTLQDLADATNSALESCGFPAQPLEKYNRFVGDGVLKLCERALPAKARTGENVERVHEGFGRFYAQGYLRHTLPYPGVPALLAALRDQGVKLAVFSNKPHAFTEKIVEAFFPGTFLAAFGKREGVPKKPDPAGVYELLSLAGVPAERAVYIGDSSVDVATGKNAGLCTAGCAWGFRGEQELRLAGADFIAQDPAELLRRLTER